MVLLAMACALALPAAAAAKKHKLPSGLPYGPSPEEVLKPYAAPAPGAPTVVLVHGGGWHVQRRRTERTEQAEELQAQGFAVFNVDYPQDSPTLPAFPMEVQAIERAISYAQANAAAYDGDGENIVLVGGSAGGNLVELAAEQVPVRAVVALSAPSDLAALLTEELRVAKIEKDVHEALGCLQSACSTSFAEAWSPALHVSYCPVWQLFASKGDPVPPSQAQEMLAALQAAGCEASLTVLRGKKHAFEYWSKVDQAVYSFIAEH